MYGRPTVRIEQIILYLQGSPRFPSWCEGESLPPPKNFTLPLPRCWPFSLFQVKASSLSL